MNISLILGHPRQESFCHAIAETAATILTDNGHSVLFHDLYAEGFDPLVRAEESLTRVSQDPLVEQHCTEIGRAEGLVVVHPNWWGQPPAILKGWVDRVVRPGVAYELSAGEGGARTRHVGKLRIRTAVVFNTSDTPLEVERSRFGNTLEIFWKTYVGDLCGIPEMKRVLFSVVGTSIPEARTAWLGEVRTLLASTFTP
jgi:putative NADPH-quinone reductase